MFSRAIRSPRCSWSLFHFVRTLVSYFLWALSILRSSWTWIPFSWLIRGSLMLLHCLFITLGWFRRSRQHWSSSITWSRNLWKLVASRCILVTETRSPISLNSWKRPVALSLQQSLELMRSSLIYRSSWILSSLRQIVLCEASRRTLKRSRREWTSIAWITSSFHWNSSIAGWRNAIRVLISLIIATGSYSRGIIIKPENLLERMRSPGTGSRCGLGNVHIISERGASIWHQNWSFLEILWAVGRVRFLWWNLLLDASFWVLFRLFLIVRRGWRSMLRLWAMISFRLNLRCGFLWTWVRPSSERRPTVGLWRRRRGSLELVVPLNKSSLCWSSPFLCIVLTAEVLGEKGMSLTGWGGSMACSMRLHGASWLLVGFSIRSERIAKGSLACHLLKFWKLYYSS